MFNNNKVLVVIPAMGDSKDIPRKNIRLLHDKPLIAYSIGIAKASQYVDDIVVATDDSEIALISEKFGSTVFKHSNELDSDEMSPDSVIYDAMIQKEKIAFDEFDIIINLQPTSPLLKTQTLDGAIEKFDDYSIDSVITVVDDRQLRWGLDESTQKFIPNYSQRLNRQHLPRAFKETGAILASRREFITSNSILGNHIDLVEVSREESVDIESYEDWWIAENYLKRKRVAIVVNAYSEIGTGHIFRCLALASKLIYHDILFLIDEQHQLGVDIVNSYNYPFKLYKGKKDLLNSLKMYSPDIVINDILDTSRDYIFTLKENGYFVINFEDLGEGAECADLVFDALYEHDVDSNNIFTGPKYFILRDEFYLQPDKIITNTVNNVLITFGGSDPNNYTQKVLDSILATNYEGRINVILGWGYEDVDGIVERYGSHPLIQIYQHVSNISEFIFNADIIFTSPRRTLYEICSLGVPTICLCQNEREMSHTFGNIGNGFINMGLGYNLENQRIIDEFINLVNNYDLRVAMNNKMLSIDLENGFENIWYIVREKYRQTKLNKLH